MQNKKTLMASSEGNHVVDDEVLLIIFCLISFLLFYPL